MKNLIHIHYIGNVILALVFFILRTVPPMCRAVFSASETVCSLDWSEWQICSFLAVIVIFKNKKQANWVAYITNSCMYCKIASVVLFFRYDPKYAIIYGIIALVHFVLCPEPTYHGPEEITYFRGPHLEDEVQSDTRITWLVCFYAAWSPDCVSFAPVFASMSIKYSLPNLRFGKMDASRYQTLAERLRIDVSATSKQLPTVILFQGGKERRRRPYIDVNGKVTRFVMAEEYLVKDLDLVNIYEDCKKNPLKIKKSKVGANSSDTKPATQKKMD